MNELQINNTIIRYNITKKNNKNTYYYFKQDGYLQINLAKHQSSKKAISYIIEHASTFEQKYIKHCINTPDPTTLYLWGVPYKRVKTTSKKVTIDYENRVLFEPENDIDHRSLKSFQKQLIQQELDVLIDRYKNNPYVNIDGIKYTIRSMTSRHGSCNKTKRRISLNLRLVQYETRFLEYIFLHEIAHLIHANHSTMYYQLLGKLCPNHERLRRDLRDQ